MALESEFPREFGRYTLVQNLGAGGMGMVYLAWGGTKEAPMQCVLKTIRPGFNGPGAEVRFMDEARISTMLRHNNICTVFDVGEVSAEYFMAMEYMGRITLRNLFDRAAETQNGVSLEMAVWIACEILNGLYYAHSYKNEQGILLNIVHRDVSPQNIMITSNGEVKLIDFGLAYSDEKIEKTEVGATQGKIQYMAPEQVKAESIGPQADLFAVAMLIYEMVVGERFYAGLAGKHEIWQVAGGGYLPQKWGLFEQMAPELAAYTKKALSTKPGDRWQDALVFRKALQKFVNHSSREMPDSLEMKALLHRLWPSLEADERKYILALPKPYGLPNRLPYAKEVQNILENGGFGANRKIEDSGHTLTQFEKKFKPDSSAAAVEQTQLVKASPKKQKSKGAFYAAFAALLFLLGAGGAYWAWDKPAGQKAKPVVSLKKKAEQVQALAKVRLLDKDVPLALEKENKDIKVDEKSAKAGQKKKRAAKIDEKSARIAAVKRAVRVARAEQKKEIAQAQKAARIMAQREKAQAEQKVLFRPGQFEKEAAQVEITKKAVPKKTPLSKIEKMRADLRQCQNPCAKMWLKKLQGRSQIDGSKSILIGRCIRKCN